MTGEKEDTAAPGPMKDNPGQEGNDHWKAKLGGSADDTGRIGNALQTANCNEMRKLVGGEMSWNPNPN